MYQLKNSYCDCKSNSSIIPIPGKIVNQDILISKLIFRAAVRAAIEFFFYDVAHLGSFINNAIILVKL